MPDFQTFVRDLRYRLPLLAPEEGEAKK
ncbi:protein of unknown function [Methylacidimicrobium sp. AP8]|nr:protein of unknown function [Methylacidimicrobium sp. AP8]